MARPKPLPEPDSGDPRLDGFVQCEAFCRLITAGDDARNERLRPVRDAAKALRGRGADRYPTRGELDDVWALVPDQDRHWAINQVQRAIHRSPGVVRWQPDPEAIAQLRRRVPAFDPNDV